MLRGTDIPLSCPAGIPSRYHERAVHQSQCEGLHARKGREGQDRPHPRGGDERSLREEPAGLGVHRGGRPGIHPGPVQGVTVRGSGREGAPGYRRPGQQGPDDRPAVLGAGPGRVHGEPDAVRDQPRSRDGLDRDRPGEGEDERRGRHLRPDREPSTLLHSGCRISEGEAGAPQGQVQAREDPPQRLLKQSCRTIASGQTPLPSPPTARPTRRVFE